MIEGQLVEHGDLLSVCKQAQEGCVAMLEPKRELAIRLLITGSEFAHIPLGTYLTLMEAKLMTL